ncbi:unnamed protein product, partial [Allacma fusca]
GRNLDTNSILAPKNLNLALTGRPEATSTLRQSIFIQEMPRVLSPHSKFWESNISRQLPRKKVQESTIRYGSPIFPTIPIYLLEIETLYKLLNEYTARKAKDMNAADPMKWSLLPLHSTITNEDQQKVFQPVPKAHRKIILATNIAESSITVTDITYVIDFCLTKSLS